MSDLWRGESPDRQDIRGELPPGVEAFEAPHLFLLHTVLVYHRTLVSMGRYPRVLIFRLNRLPYLDGRGARSIVQLAQLCRGRRALLVLSEVHPEAWRLLGQEGVLDDVGPGNVFTEWNAALNRARGFLGLG